MSSASSKSLLASPLEPYDPTTLSEKIITDLAGLEELQAYLRKSNQGAIGKDTQGTKKDKVTRFETVDLGQVGSTMRVHLGDTWWVEMKQEEVESLLERKQAGE